MGCLPRVRNPSEAQQEEHDGGSGSICHRRAHCQAVRWHETKESKDEDRHGDCQSVHLCTKGINWLLEDHTNAQKSLQLCRIAFTLLAEQRTVPTTLACGLWRIFARELKISPHIADMGVGRR